MTRLLRECIPPRIFRDQHPPELVGGVCLSKLASLLRSLSFSSLRMFFILLYSAFLSIADCAMLTGLFVCLHACLSPGRPPLLYQVFVPPLFFEICWSTFLAYVYEETYSSNVDQGIKQRWCHPTVPSNVVQHLPVMLDTINTVYLCCFNIAGERWQKQWNPAHIKTEEMDFGHQYGKVSQKQYIFKYSVFLTKPEHTVLLNEVVVTGPALPLLLLG